MKTAEKTTVTQLALSALIAVISTCALAKSPSYSPYVNPEFPQNLYWGDLHVHTERSQDANSMGNRLSPEMAYRFAKGETVVSTSGIPMKLSRPLDFMLISDHSEFMGLFSLLRNGDRRAFASPPGQRWGELFKQGENFKLMAEIMRVNFSPDQPATVAEFNIQQDPDLLRSVWEDVTAIADRHNQPGTFTAFIGYEWTSMPRGDNLHRNILYRDNAKAANQTLPFSSMQSQNPEDLWVALEAYETKSRGRVLAIPHNANGSNGLMFSDKTYEGNRLTRAYAKTRLRWEPIVEVTQIKGDGEAHPFLSPDDSFADFESWDTMNMGGGIPKQDWMLKHEYARGALKLGLQLEDTLGTNPFKFGMIGSSDTHTSLAAVEENNFSGKFTRDEPHGRIGQSLLTDLLNNTQGDRFKQIAAVKANSNEDYAAAGYAAVWARENTREALFDAMQRKETFASTGPRFSVRFFGGWEFVTNDDKRSDYVALGYRKGVPMGGDLTQAPGNTAPSFLVVASKDPIGANLDRVQIIKGWMDKFGQTHEKIYDVALSDNRSIDTSTGQAPTLPSTVDIATATYTNSRGAAQLSAVWQDPDFDPKQRAFYYTRVIEIPTPRWTTYEAVLYGQPIPDNVPAEIQERAYTSPIWYTP